MCHRLGNKRVKTDPEFRERVIAQMTTDGYIRAVSGRKGGFDVNPELIDDTTTQRRMTPTGKQTAELQAIWLTLDMLRPDVDKRSKRQVFARMMQRIRNATSLP